MQGESVLKFRDYWLEQVSFRKNPLFAGQKNMDLSVTFGVRYAAVADGSMRVSIRCDLFEETFTPDSGPYYLQIIMTGEFSVEGRDLADKQAESLLKANTLAILFPYLRAVVTNIISSANMGTIILPPVNTYKLIESEM